MDVTPEDSTGAKHEIQKPSREEVILARQQRKESKKKRKRVDDPNDERPLPEEHHCSFWMSKKRRYCSLARHAGSTYCTDHLSTVDGQKRIPCPIDPRHYIYESDKDRHIRLKCPARLALGADDPWFSLDINAGESDSEYSESDEEMPTALDANVSEQSAPTQPSEELRFEVLPEFRLKHRKHRPSVISTISSEIITELIRRLDGIWAVYEPQVSTQLIISEIPPIEGVTAPLRIKHAIQNESIVCHLKAANMWDNKLLYIEWGCGNGNLSQHIQQQLHSDHILIDRKTPKTKGDSKRDRTKLWKRIKIDIKDFVLDQVPELEADHSRDQSKYTSICSFSKHLCGAATDLTIRCLEQHRSGNQDSFLVALCCHHRCTWRSYVGRSFFEDQLGLTSSDFDVMARMSSWATSCDHASNEPNEDLNTTLSNEEKKMWGWRCKRLIDVGRMHYLHKLGYSSALKYYVPPEISLENILMICTKGSKPE